MSAVWEYQQKSFITPYPSYAWNIFAAVLGPRGPTKGNVQLIRQNDFFFTSVKLVYCLSRKTLKCNSLILKICMFLQKQTSHCKYTFALGPQWPPKNISGDHFYSENARKLRFHVFLLFLVRKHMIFLVRRYYHFTWSRPNSQEILNFVPIVELNLTKFTIFCQFDLLQAK